MASIFPRENKDGSIVYRLQIRRKGLNNFITTFSTVRDAQEFAKKYEEQYCLDPNFNYDYLRAKRQREFNKV